MKQYVIDELRPGESEKIKVYLEEKFGKSAIPDIYWIPLENDCLTQEQLQHTDCSPHCFAVVIEQNLMACEFLIRSKNRLRCDCVAYADEHQQKNIIRFADGIFDALGIQI